ncbi:alpha/beta hydrolase [Saccharobesus litoralis]|uniref:Alpha/beta hydrolase n=2 Tax=Saccharobesus litoralis TaxID=2172099 RepID=A0A2S0VY49_9ALTE|nr:alpha/beta hydrolase [Saccharobesus litoralis]
MANLLLAHGAGAGSDHEFMQSMAQLVASQGVNVILFDFPYMQTMQQTGKRRPPDKLDKLINSFCQQVTELDSALPLFIAGKSMGGRVATHIACLDRIATCVKGCVALGYPFHPPGKPEKLRLDHFPAIQIPLKIIQGERDTFGNQQEVATFPYAERFDIKWLVDGDHSFKPRKASGVTYQENLQCAANTLVEFIQLHV